MENKLKVGVPYFKNGAFRVDIIHEDRGLFIWGQGIMAINHTIKSIENSFTVKSGGILKDSTQAILDIHKDALMVLKSYVAKKKGEKNV